MTATDTTTQIDTNQHNGFHACAGATLTLKLGDRVQGCTDPDDDWIGGEIVEFAQYGVFIRSTDSTPDVKGRVFGIPWDCLLLDTAALKGRVAPSGHATPGTNPHQGH